MKVARHGFNPRIRHANERTAQVRIGKSHRLEHRPRARAIPAFSNSTANMLEIHSECPVKEYRNFSSKWQGGKVAKFQGFKRARFKSFNDSNPQRFQALNPGRPNLLCHSERSGFCAAKDLCNFVSADQRSMNADPRKKNSRNRRLFAV